MNIVAELDHQTEARLGAGRLTLRLHEGQLLSRQFSKATVGRMLAKIRKRCPMCRQVNRHDTFEHYLKRYMLTIEIVSAERKALKDFAVSGIGTSPP